MLVLSRKANQKVVIEGGIVVHVIEIRGDKVRIGFEAPKDLAIHREEVWLAIQREESEAANANPS